MVVFIIIAVVVTLVIAVPVTSAVVTSVLKKQEIGRASCRERV